MIRRLFTVASVLFLLTCVPLVVLEVWGRASAGDWAWARWGALWQVKVESGRVVVTRLGGWPGDEPIVRTDGRKRLWIASFQRPRPSSVWFASLDRNRGIAYSSGAPDGTLIGLATDPWGKLPSFTPAPTWEFDLYPQRLLAAAVVLPVVWVVIRLISLRRRRPGICQVCGYDLRASEHRCPECGTPIPTEVETKA